MNAITTTAGLGDERRGGRGLFGRILGGRGERRRMRRRAVGLGMERLEGRELKTAGVVLTSYHEAFIEADSAGDAAFVSQSGGTIDIKVSSAGGPVRDFQFNASQVNSICFDGGAGNDTFVNNTGIWSGALGGGGNDILIGGSNEDYLEGDSGTNILDGRGGDDYLAGGTGNDLMFGGDGDDTMYGGTGNDLMFGGAGDDDLNGGYGDDVLDGGSGWDNLSDRSGTNRFYDDYMWFDRWFGYVQGGSSDTYHEGHLLSDSVSALTILTANTGGTSSTSSSTVPSPFDVLPYSGTSPAEAATGYTSILNLTKS